MYGHLADNLKDIYFALFSASITMTGLIAVFAVFRYQIIDTYVDNRKPILRSLLDSQIQMNPDILIRIQDIGKNNKPKDDVEYFRQFNNPAVNRFVEDILKYRKQRYYVLRLGMSSIITWAVLSLIYLFVSLCFPISNCLCARIINGIVIVLFIGSIAFTLIFVYISFYKKYQSFY